MVQRVYRNWCGGERERHRPGAERTRQRAENKRHRPGAERTRQRVERESKRTETGGARERRKRESKRREIGLLPPVSASAKGVKRERESCVRR